MEFGRLEDLEFGRLEDLELEDWKIWSWKTGRFGAGRLKQEVKDGRLEVET
uniref:hypothetical protein n=1 Tax=Segatella hominis TaxID=2518605 RepID=UPI00402973E7